MKIRVLVGVLLVAVACRKSGTTADPTAVVQVKTAVVAVQPFEDRVGSIGTVVVHSGHLASLSAPAPARITTVYVSVGQKVSAGTPLIAFEQTPFITTAQSAEAALAVAQQAYDRARRLADAGIVPRATAERCKTRERSAALKHTTSPSPCPSDSKATNREERPAHAGPSHDHRANRSPVGTSSADRGCAAMVSVAHRK